ncbi:glycosyltransferase family 39 protein [Actinomadura algeriensis]|uniref:Mannosyltransferase n=1 Tax=Actinomadura algeriensis TaxID=1679523 RepID=A0ABR9JS46_9ACTN|nr:glycosyltransferase family 39 protein [Actinomadura algeriensis]MBE1533394.1 mannosyltransferase [Actinomadura algeriensis]
MTATPHDTPDTAPPESAAEPRRDGRAPRFLNGRLLNGRFLPLLPAALTLAVSLIGIRRPSLWLDEAATISMASRPYGDMFAVFDHLDLVHALYYTIMRPWVLAFGTGELAMRLPSALATAAAAAGVTVLVRRLHGTSAALLGGLAFAVAVQTSRWSAEARSYAMVAAVAVLATYLLVRAVEPDARRRWPWFAGYVPAVMALGFLHLHGVLLVAAHGATLLLIRAAPGIWARWLAASALAAAPLVPFALAARDQTRQVAWLPEPSWDVVWTQVVFVCGSRPLVLPVLALAVVGAIAGLRPPPGARSAVPSGARSAVPSGARSAVPLTAVAVPWLVLPTVLLLVVSMVGDPMFYYRYTVYTLPALGLLAGAGLARIVAVPSRRAVQGVVLAVAAAALVVPSLEAHDVIRREQSRPENMRKAANAVRNHARPGDAVVYLAGIVRWTAASYPDVFGRLDDVGMRVDPVTDANLKGRDVAPRDLTPKLARYDRVWVMNHRSLDPHGPIVDRRELAVQAAGPWREIRTWTFRGGWLVLFERTGPHRPPPRR